MQSIVSYRDRGIWGDNKYRGNTTGHIIKDLLIFFKPNQFVEVFSGGGTGFDVARSMGYENSIHLDLNGLNGTSFNILIDELPQGSDFVFSHPPYHNMILYSGNMWGEPHPHDLSRCASYGDFIKKMNTVNSKIYNSLVNGGRHAMLIGDMRKKGIYYSMIKDLAWYGDLEAHVIKAQHNYLSESHVYSNNNFILIVHEHLLVFRKNSVWAIPIAFTKAVVKNLKESTLATWRDLVQAALQHFNGQSNLKNLYAILADTEKAKNNPHFKEKIRQTLQIYKEFVSVERGLWKLAI